MRSPTFSRRCPTAWSPCWTLSWALSRPVLVSFLARVALALAAVRAFFSSALRSLRARVRAAFSAACERCLAVLVADVLRLDVLRDEVLRDEVLRVPVAVRPAAATRVRALRLVERLRVLERRRLGA